MSLQGVSEHGEPPPALDDDALDDAALDDALDDDALDTDALDDDALALAPPTLLDDEAIPP